jgi:hypothetical protein
MSNEVDPAGLGEKVLSLLRLGPGSELQIDLCRDGSLRITKDVKS